MKRFLLVFFNLLIVLGAVAELDNENKTSVEQLSRRLDALPDAMQQRGQRLDSLKTLRENEAVSERRVELGLELGQLYEYQSVDSALMYLRLALADARLMEEKDKETEILLRIFALFPSLGMTHEAQEGLAELLKVEQSQDIKRKCLEAEGVIMFATASYYPEGRYQNYYINRTLETIDSLMPYYRGESTAHLLLAGFKHMLRNEDNLAVANFVEVLPQVNDNEQLYEQIASAISDYYAERPDYRQQYIKYMLQRTIHSLECGVLRAGLLAETGAILNEEGYTELGDRCLRLAMETSEVEKGPYRTFDRSRFSRYILNEASHRSQALVWWVVVIVILLLLSVTALLFMYNKMRDLKKECRLAIENSLTREESMRTLATSCFSLVFSSVEQLRDYNIHVGRKLTAGQVKDLYSEVESGRYLQRCNEKFFECFDSLVLNNIPNFIERLNKLLLPEKQLREDENGQLSPELRIAAFMRIGVTDSAKLSQLLGLSLNTIYTYRNRLKSRAIDRESFEQDLRTV